MAGRRTSTTLEMLLLSLLANGDTLSGYQISMILAEPISLLWTVKHSQIYPALAALEERGDILGKLVVQTSRPNKREYGITSPGLERLKKWLLESRSKLNQDEIRLIAYNLDLLGEDVVVAAMATYRAQCIDEKRQLEERWPGVWQSPWADHAGQSRMVGIRSIYEHALSIRDAQILWCDQGIDRAKAAVARTDPRTT